MWLSATYGYFGLFQYENLVPSETVKHKLYKIDMKKGLFECAKGALKGHCKYKGIVAHIYKMKNFEILPQEWEHFIYFLGTGTEHESDWFYTS